jgi:hypothetical protein
MHQIGLREQSPRFGQGSGSRHHILKGLRKTATKRYLIYAGGVGGSGFLVWMFFYDAPTRILRVRGPQFGTAQGKTVDQANGQNLWVNF